VVLQCFVRANEKGHTQKIVLVVHADMTVIPADGYVPSLIVEGDCAAGLGRDLFGCAFQHIPFAPNSAAAQVAAASSRYSVAFIVSAINYETCVQPLVVLFRLEHLLKPDIQNLPLVLICLSPLLIYRNETFARWAADLSADSMSNCDNDSQLALLNHNTNAN